MLIVEDERALRRLLCLNLELAGGFEVVAETGDGAHGLSLTEALLPDVLVIDLRLPSLDGLCVIRELAERAPGVRVIVFTGWNEPDERERALAAGVSEYILKAGEIRTLLRSIRAVGSLCA